MEPLNQNANEQKIMEKQKIPASLTLLASPMQHK
jgi:hypothetical protein